MTHLSESGQAGELTLDEAINLASDEIQLWAQSDECRVRPSAIRIFEIYGRVRRAVNCEISAVCN